MAFYLVFSVPVYVIMLRLTITQILFTIIIIKQVPSSSKIIVIFETTIRKVHPSFIHEHLPLQCKSWSSIAIRSLFSEIFECSMNTWISQNSEKAWWSLSVDRLYLYLTVAEAAHDMQWGVNPFLQSQNFLIPSQNSTPFFNIQGVSNRSR